MMPARERKGWGGRLPQARTSCRWDPSAVTGQPRLCCWLRWWPCASGAVVATARWRPHRLRPARWTRASRFLAHRALESNGEVGNYGLEDQQATRRRSHRRRIGRRDVGLRPPGGAGFGRAVPRPIIQTGPCRAQADRPTAQRVSAEYGESLGCPDGPGDAECLRALLPSRLTEPPATRPRQSRCARCPSRSGRATQWNCVNCSTSAVRSH
jgi:hypothetical protein